MVLHSAQCTQVFEHLCTFVQARESVYQQSNEILSHQIPGILQYPKTQLFQFTGLWVFWNFFLYFIRPAPWATYVTISSEPPATLNVLFIDDVFYFLYYDILYFP